MTLIHGPWGSADDGDAEKRVIMPPSKREPSKELVPQVFEAEIVDPVDDPDAPVPVDLPAVPDVRRRWERPAELRPVIPDWAADPETRADVISWHLHRTWYGFRYHGVRSPWYAVRLAAKSPVGAARVAGAGVRWASAAYLNERIEPVRTDPRAVTSLTIEQSRQAGIRLTVLATGLLAVTVGWWVLGRNHVGWDRPLIVVLLLLALGYIADRRSDRRVITAAVSLGGIRKLTADIVIRGFMSAKLCTEDDLIKFRSPIVREEPGWGVVLDLPYSTTADKAIKRRIDVAAGLDYDERCVFLSRVRGPDGSARRIKLWVADADPLSLPAGRSPLVDTKQVNFWQAFPWGLDERGNVISLCMLWLSMLVGSIPRRGKSYAARLIALAAALDPDVRIQLYDLKGGADWRPFRHVAHRLQYGDRADPETGIDPIEQLLADMLDLQSEVDHRYRTLRHLPDSVIPEGKLTEDLARSKDAHMPLVLVLIDEVQRAFEHKVYGKDLEDVLTDLVKVAPAVGVMMLVATQKPDKTASPSRFRDQFGARFALRCSNWQMSDVILGSGAYSDGYDASRLPEEDAVKGVGILRGTGDVEIKGGAVRTFLADRRDAETICVRARKLREQKGTLSGVALGEIPVAEKRQEWTVVADLLVVMDAREAKVHSDVLCQRLSEKWPERYGSLDPRGLASMLKGYDVETDRNCYTSRPDGSKTTKAGVHRQTLLDASL